MDWLVALGGFSGGLGILIALGIAVWAWRRRARLQHAITAHACPACHSRFDEAIVEFLGPVRSADRARLDAFQQRFAAYRFQCGDCGAVVITTADATPFVARYECEE